MENNKNNNPDTIQDDSAAIRNNPVVPLAATDPEQDGRNKEWEDRARVNLEVVPDGVSTNIERDFEPEQESDKPEPNQKKPAY